MLYAAGIYTEVDYVPVKPKFKIGFCAECGTEFRRRYRAFCCSKECLTERRRRQSRLGMRFMRKHKPANMCRTCEAETLTRSHTYCVPCGIEQRRAAAAEVELRRYEREKAIRDQIAQEAAEAAAEAERARIAALEPILTVTNEPVRGGYADRMQARLF